MTLILKKGLRLRNTWRPMDPDAAAYITAVEAADGQALEERVKIAIDNFVLGCKADGIWSAIKASCILAGARTLAGALVPLVGAAPTNFNFVAGDYNRKTGLVGDGSTKYLNSNRLQNADPVSSFHMAIMLSSVGIINGNVRYIGAYAGPGLSDDFLASDGDLRNRSRDTAANMTVAIGLYGTSRSNATTFVARANRANVDGLTTIANTTGSQNHFVFAQNENGSIFGRSNARLAFYSIGESIDLALLDARVTALVNALAVAIP